MAYETREAALQRLMPRIRRALAAVRAAEKAGELKSLKAHNVAALIDGLEDWCRCRKEHSRGPCVELGVVGEPMRRKELAADEYEVPFHYADQDLIVVTEMEYPDDFYILRVYPAGAMEAQFDAEALLELLRGESGGPVWEALENATREMAQEKLAGQRDDADEARAEQARDDRRMGLDR